MVGTLIVGLLLIVWAAINWYIEIKPWLAVRRRPTSKDRFHKRIWIGIYNFGTFFTHGKYLILDMAITIISTSVFGFGEGVMGGIMGIGFSNIVSCVILYVQRQDLKYKQME